MTQRPCPFLVDARDGDHWTSNLERKTKDGTHYYALECRTIRDAKGRIDGSFLNIRNETQSQLNLKQESYRARHDELTELYTKTHLFERIGEVLAAAPGGVYSVAFANVSNFKLVNDIFGSEFGDKVLTRMADLLREIAPEGGVYGRLGGDTFGLLFPPGTFDEAKVEQRLVDFSVNAGEIDYHVLIHMGVYEVTDASLEVSVMFDRARIAASSVRNDYHTHIAWYDDALRVQLVWEQQISGDLRGALAERQIVPYLQPLVDADGRVVGAEALVRWNHPEYGFLSPARFVPVFEQNGMIAEVDRCMWRCACEQLARWRDRDLFISVNISPKDFYFMDVAA